MHYVDVLSLRLPERTGENQTNASPDIWCSSRDLNPARPKHKSREFFRCLGRQCHFSTVDEICQK